MEFVAIALFGLGLSKYNERKKEELRTGGYPGNRREYYKPAGETDAKKTERLINTRIVYSKCIYWIDYQAGGRTEAKTWLESVEYEPFPIEHVLGSDLCEDLSAELEEEKCHKYFGVVRRKDNYLKDHDAPEWIIAVRGTDILKLADLIKDAKLFLEIQRNNSFRLLHAVVKELITKHKRENVVLTGYSLGAAASMLVGRRLAQEGTYVETHLFNPPFFSLKEVCWSFSLHDVPMTAQLKCIINFIDFVTHILRTIATGIDRSSEGEHSRYTNLRGWAPHIYVDAADLISQKFINYDTLYAQRRSEWRSVDSIHLLPSAVLHISDKYWKIRFFSAHMLWNWTRADNPYRTKEVSISGGNK